MCQRRSSIADRIYQPQNPLVLLGFRGVLSGGATIPHEAARDGLLTSSRIAFCAIANALVFCVPGHVAFADNAAMPIEAFMATADAERCPMIGDWSFKLGTTMTAEVA